jgi:hypothetical protein
MQMTTFDDRETIVGRLIYRQHHQYLQLEPDRSVATQSYKNIKQSHYDFIMSGVYLLVVAFPPQGSNYYITVILSYYRK